MAKQKVNKDTGEVVAGKTVQARGNTQPLTEEQIAARVRQLREEGSRRVIGYAPTFEFLMPGDEVTGVIADYREGIGQYESALVALDSEEYGPVSVWLGADLTMKIRKEHVGLIVTIIYVKQLDIDMGNPMKVYEVLFADKEASASTPAA
jgi:hypothetical protein